MIAHPYVILVVFMRISCEDCFLYYKLFHIRYTFTHGCFSDGENETLTKKQFLPSLNIPSR